MNIDPLKSATEMGRQIHVSSVLNSILWPLPYSLSAFVLVSFTDNFFAQIFLMFINGGLLLSVIFCYILMLFRDPNLLRSEKHIFLMKALEMLGDQDNTVKELVDSEARNNPDIQDPKNVKTPEFEEIKNLETN